ncbi:MAG TPA: SRPBCC domain-containing protein, partial [Gemmatimonadales bacterium]
MKGTATRSASRQVARELTLDVPAEAVWKALTDAAELTRWFPLEARVRPGSGGAIWMKWEGVYEAESPIEAWEPGRHLRTVFPLHEPVRLSTDYYLESDKGRTVLRVVTSGFGEGTDWDEWFAGVNTGWDFELRSLKHYLERHQGTDRVALSVRASYRSSTADAWNRLAGIGAWLSFDEVSVAGSRYRARTQTGEELTGMVEQWLPPRQVVLTVDQYNDGIMR